MMIQDMFENGTAAAVDANNREVRWYFMMKEENGTMRYIYEPMRKKQAGTMERNGWIIIRDEKGGK